MLTLTLIHLTETANKLIDFYWTKCKGQSWGGLDIHSSIQLSSEVSKQVTGISVCDPGSCLHPPPCYEVLDKTLYIAGAAAALANNGFDCGQQYATVRAFSTSVRVLYVFFFKIKKRVF